MRLTVEAVRKHLKLAREDKRREAADVIVAILIDCMTDDEREIYDLMAKSSPTRGMSVRQMMNLLDYRRTTANVETTMKRLVGYGLLDYEQDDDLYFPVRNPVQQQPTDPKERSRG